MANFKEDNYQHFRMLAANVKKPCFLSHYILLEMLSYEYKTKLKVTGNDKQLLGLNSTYQKKARPIYVKSDNTEQ